MPNITLCGQTGAGKTTAGMERIVLPHFRDGGIIVTNISIRDKLAAWIEEFGQEAIDSRLILLDAQLEDGSYTFGKIEDFERYLQLRDDKGRGPMFVVDEAHKPIPAGMRFPVDKTTGQRVMTAFPNQLLTLFTDQRHHLINLVLITQDPFTIASPILKQMHSTLYFENAEMKGSSKRYTVKIWNGPPPRNYDVTKKYDDAELKPKSYSQDTWRFFVSNSKTKTVTVGRDVEGRYKHARSIWKRPIVLALIPCSLAMLYFGSDIMSIGSPAKSTVSIPSKSPAKGSSNASAPKTPPAPEYAPSDVVADLGALEHRVAASETRRGEAAYPVMFYHFNAKPQGALQAGPTVVVHYPGDAAPSYALMADYAAYWGYSIEPTACGWILTRSDNVRHLYDSHCLARTHHAQQTAAAAPSSALVASQLGQSQSGTAALAGESAPALP